MRLKEARLFFDLMTAHRLNSVLELGFFHGVSTAYLAGIVAEMDGGRVTTIDLTTAIDRTPNIEELLNRCGLRNLVDIFYEPRTFNWRLMKFLEQEPKPSFDLCYIDGGHTWTDSGFAFCLVRELLGPGGWIVFDDIPHTYRNSTNRDKSWVRRLPEEEQITPQVERVFTLLTMRDPQFDTFRKIGNLGIARKRPLGIIAAPSAHFVEQQIFTAAHRARTDPVLRHKLLQQPARVLSEISGEPEKVFRNVRIAESDLWSPLEPDLDENGIVTHFLERPEWDKRVSEEELLALMHH